MIKKLDLPEAVRMCRALMWKIWALYPGPICLRSVGRRAWVYRIDHRGKRCRLSPHTGVRRLVYWLHGFSTALRESQRFQEEARARQLEGKRSEE